MVAAALPRTAESVSTSADALACRREWGDREDAALAAAIAGGDAMALDQLYLRYRPAAFATAVSLLRDPSAAEDVVHDAFLSVWRAAASFRPERGSLRAWLMTIVRNAAIDHLRSRRVAPQLQKAIARFEITGTGEDDVHAAVVAAADARRLRAAVQTLPPAQRDAVELAFFGGLTHCEIAARTGLPLGTVKGRLRLGLRRLRQDLHDLAPAAPGSSPRPALSQ
jgi:RNA polymerase sigma-70 factor (ECF subfamily)